jgi:nicotinamide riboside transporter PnuC
LTKHLRELNFWLQVIGAALGLLGQNFINQRNSAGFVCWIVSNIALIVLQYRTRLRVLVVLHSIYLLLSVQGFYLWLGH